MSLLVSRLRDLRGTTHRVRWQVDGREKNRTFATRALADSFRSDLSAARRGEPFDTATGLPVSLRPKATGPTWLAHAKALVDAKWGESSPAHRKSTAEALVTISCRVDPRRRHLPRPEDAQGGSPALVVQPSDSQTTHAAPERYVEALAWAERTSRPLSDLADPTTVRDVLAACGRRLEGRPAAASVATRKRAALSLALVCAVEQGHLDGNR